MPPSDPLFGRTLNGRYEVMESIGTGGMATVYRARDLRLGRDVAIKILHPQFAADTAFVERFRQEAEFAASLSTHPNIVSIFDVGEDADLHYIVMELVDGQNLKDCIRSEGPLTVDRAFSIGQAIASALAFAHQRGLIHRDIKPQNILIAGDGTVKVTDFGIARAGGDTQMTRTGMVMGTAHYLSPEQAQGQPAEPASDVYSLGVVLYEMLTGTLLFDADNALGIAMMHVHDAPPSPNRANPAIPPAAAAVVLKALNKNPADRYPSAAAFGMALQQGALPPGDQATLMEPLGSLAASAAGVQSTEAIPTQPPANIPPTPPRRTSQQPPPPPPNPWRTTLLILLALLLIAAASVGGLFAYKAATAGSGTPTPTLVPTKPPKPTAKPTAKKPTRTPIPSPSPSPTPPPSPTPKPTPKPSPTPSPTPTPTKKPKPTPTPAPSPTPAPTFAPLPTLSPTPSG